MSRFVACENAIAFHPGYYINEIIEESGLSQEEYAVRLGVELETLRALVDGEQSLSADVAAKLSEMLGTRVEYWMNLQKKYDALVAIFVSPKEVEKDQDVTLDL